MPFITNEQVSKIVKIYNDLKKDEKISFNNIEFKRSSKKGCTPNLVLGKKAKKNIFQNFLNDHLMFEYVNHFYKL